ncbi:MAG: acyl carrier protein [Myxococcales bacterium]|nr:acyl carrier protein [Myxococcales bacterium]MCB9732987.1 acyl carrier protein [Deltaproteobacteria bacterium]
MSLTAASEAALVARFVDAARAVDRRGRDFAGVTADTALDSLGLDSFSLMELVGRLEEAAGVTLSDAQLARLRTVRDVARALADEEL